MHNICMAIFMPIYEQRLLKIQRDESTKVAKF
jgi:hypothetical protein